MGSRLGDGRGWGDNARTPSVRLRVLSRRVELSASTGSDVSNGTGDVELAPPARGAELAGMGGVDVSGAGIAAGGVPVVGALAVGVILVQRIAWTDGGLITLLSGGRAELAWGRAWDQLKYSGWPCGRLRRT